MIAKLTKGAGFRGVLTYAEKSGAGELIGGNMSATNSRDLAAEFGQIRAQNQNCSRPVWHCSLSAPRGEKLTNDQWRGVAQDHLKNMGLEDHQFVIYRHNDTQHDHVHVIANRINPATLKVASDKQDFKKLQDSMRQIEKNHGLQITASGQQTAGLNMSADLKNKISQARINSKTPDEFFKNLEKHGVEHKLNIAKTGHISGISYRQGANAPWLKGSQINASWQKVNAGFNSKQATRQVFENQKNGAGKIADRILKSAGNGLTKGLPGVPGLGAVKIGVKIAQKIKSTTAKKTRDRGLEM